MNMETKYQIGDIVEFYDSRGDKDTMEILAVHDNGDYELQREWNTDWSIYVEKDRIIRLVGGPRYIPSWKATKCHRYKGTKEEYTRYINSHLWKRTKAKILARDNHKCQICGKTGLVHVHHISYDRFDHENDSDLITLCPECHDLVHYFGDRAEYELQKGIEEDYKLTPVPLANALISIGREIRQALRQTIPDTKRASFLAYCLLTMLGEPCKHGDFWERYEPINTEISHIWNVCTLPMLLELSDDWRYYD